MGNNKKPVSVGCNNGNRQQNQNAGIKSVSSSVNQFNISSQKSKSISISSFLRFGEDQAISAKQLSYITGYSERKLRLLIAKEREEGVLILSSDAGYYLPDVVSEKGRAELSHFINTMRQRAFHTLRAIKAAKAALQIPDNQEVVEGWQIEKGS